jgi:hypothetical protein
MHITGGVSRVDSDRLVMIRNGILEVSAALTLVAAITVDDRKIVPVKSAGLDGARASLDCDLAGSPDAYLAVVPCRRKNEPSGGHAGKAGANPFSHGCHELHQTPQLFGQNVLDCSSRRVHEPLQKDIRN